MEGTDKMEVKWYRYVPFSDDSIDTVDKILWVIYVLMAFLIPVSAVVSWAVINKFRKDAIHATYRKAANFSVAFIALLSFLGGLVHSCGKGSMPLTSKNMAEWVSLINKTVDNIPISANKDCENSVRRMKVMLKDTCEELGYDFDKTAVSIIKTGANNPSAFMDSNFNDLYTLILAAYSLREKCPNEVVDEGLFAEDTLEIIKDTLRTMEKR